MALQGETTEQLAAFNREQEWKNNLNKGETQGSGAPNKAHSSTQSAHTDAKTTIEKAQHEIKKSAEEALNKAKNKG